MKVMRPPIHNPTKPHCFLTHRASNPEDSRTNVSEETLCTWQPWLVRTAPGLPQESLVRDETRISLPANPSLAQTTLGYLCVAPRPSRSRPVMTEPGHESLVAQLVLQYSALNHCATQEAAAAPDNANNNLHTVTSVSPAQPAQPEATLYRLPSLIRTPLKRVFTHTLPQGLSHFVCLSKDPVESTVTFWSSWK